jgi:hypothetical protein
MKRASLVLLVILGLAPQAPVWSGAWGRVFAAEVRGNGLAEPLITHGIADTWMYASSRWNERVGAAISKRLSAQP